jgi:Zn finger protein HypA/HybF involved in hydrogenase expression
MESHDEIVLGQTIGKEYNEWRLSYPGKDEFVANGLFYCNRQDCLSFFQTFRDRKLVSLFYILSRVKGLTNNSAHIREQEKPVICPHCHTRMGYQTDMKTHAQTHLKDELRQRYSCPVCGDLFTKLCNMKRHEKKH